jgi:hypothetical protein
MKQGLFLDDERKPSQVTWVRLPTDVTWKVVRSYDEFVRWFELNDLRGLPLPEVITFDHDLSFEHYTDIGNDIDYSKKEKTGYHAAQWFTDYLDQKGITELPDFYAHSMNPVGRNNILRHLIHWQESKF